MCGLVLLLTAKPPLLPGWNSSTNKNIKRCIRALIAEDFMLLKV